MENDISEPEENASISATGSSSDANADTDVSDTFVSRSTFSAAPQEIVVVSQDPVTRLTLWLPGQEQDAEKMQFEDNLTLQLKMDDPAELQPSATDQESLLDPHTNTANSLDSNEMIYDPNLLSEWPAFPQLDGASIAEEFQKQNKYGVSGRFGTETLLVARVPVSVKMEVNDFNLIQDNFAWRQAEAPVMPPKGENDVEPIIRSKIQFSKGKDGSQMLSYEQEMVRRQGGDGGTRSCKMDWINRKQESGQRGLYSAFLNLLR